MAGSDTKERILDAAERLFAEHTYAGVSLRTITAEANVNLAAVNYHFGSKDALLQAVFHRRARDLNRERVSLLAEIEARAGGGRCHWTTCSMRCWRRRCAGCPIRNAACRCSCSFWRDAAPTAP
ncbi:TetR/AcrR family transcriptional regulator [Tistrella bauzanensis]